MDLQRAWLERGALARLLWPLSLLFAVLAALRRGLYRAGLLRSERVPVPVLVVGNVVAGGAGKTPSVIAIVRHLQARRVPVGVISRGYGRATDDCREVLANSAPHEAGDEPLLIQRATSAPTFVGQRRIEAARALLERHPQTRLIVSDDGLQHLALARDLEICVFDDRGTGNGWLLPAGPLREPWPRPCDLVLHTGDRPAFAAGFRAQRSLAPDAIGRHGDPVALAALAGRRIVAVAAIAKPQGFFDMLRACGMALERCIALPDHHDFKDWVPQADTGLTVLCTEKDAAKLWRVEPAALAVPLVFQPEPAFFAALDAKLSSLDG
ncbi:MAG TPA: tetraacyldisaccharide 4'-kinase [Variovorax sp.]|nr:tetraacyldisaccharide 4'-kinase [Variovorax sp.]